MWRMSSAQQEITKDASLFGGVLWKSIVVH